MSSSIAPLLKSKRKDLGLSVREVLAKLHEDGIDVSDKTLYGWESGHRQPDADTFLALCQIYKIGSFSNIQKAPSDLSEEAENCEELREADRPRQRSCQGYFRIRGKVPGPLLPAGGRGWEGNHPAKIQAEWPDDSNQCVQPAICRRSWQLSRRAGFPYRAIPAQCHPGRNRFWHNHFRRQYGA